MVEDLIGERMDGSPLDDPDKGKNPAAVALGKLGGAKGGAAKAKVLTAEQRKEIAKRAALARWKSPRGDSRRRFSSSSSRWARFCSEFLDRTMRDLPCKRIQADETWSFVYAKQKNSKPEHFEDGGYSGDTNVDASFYSPDKRLLKEG